MPCRAIRGAITIDENTNDAILSDTKTLLHEMLYSNHIQTEDIVSIFFSLTPDLNATFPARAARQMGYKNIPLFCMQEIDVPEGLGKCLRILVHINSDKPNAEIIHSYLKDAHILRPDYQQNTTTPKTMDS